MEYNDDVLLQLIEAVVHQPDELLTDEAIALEREAAVALAILRVFLDSPQGHEGNELAAGIKDEGIEVLKIDGGEVAKDLVVALRLDVRLAVARLDAVDAEIDVNVQGIGGGQCQSGFSDAGITGDQHADFLCALLDVVRVSNHGDSSFQLVAASRRRVMISWHRKPKLLSRYIPVSLNFSSS